MIHLRTYTVKRKQRIIRLYSVWRSMRRRCNSQSSDCYDRYGGRGIYVCNEWNDYDAFRLWAINNGYKKHLTIDRIDNDGPYSPDNCQWVTNHEQHSNTRRNRLITFRGETKHIAEWARQMGIHRSTLRLRLNNWPLEKAMTSPVNESMRRN